MVTAITGKWKLESSENFDKYMEVLGISWHTRKIGLIAKPVVTFTISNDQWKMITDSPIKRMEVSFKLGEEVECQTPYKVKTISVFTIVDETILRETQKQDDEIITIIDRQLDINDQLIATCTAKDIVSKRVYKRL
ncbi:hypothetical protein GJ496_011076 [Pomphorhynchus laevis]|nr:hypothetical protein GJ496_011076 [Pomphorhynchus laevis]